MNIELGNIGKIILSKEIIDIIDSLHNSIGSTEWSGILFYQLTKGNIAKMKDLEFKAKFIYPMNIGSHAYTEFEYNGEVMNAYDLSESLIECSNGLVHSHHSMAAFFSGTDTSELIDNAKHYNYYLSLIVSFDKEYKCKIAFPAKTKVSYDSVIKDKDGRLIKLNYKEDGEIILIGDLEIDMPKNKKVEWLEKRIADLKSQKAAIKPISYANSKYPNHNTYGSAYDFDNEYGYTPQYPSYGIKAKTTSSSESKIDIFLKKLITVNSTKYYSTIEAAMDDINLDNDTEYSIYENYLEQNVEIIHDNVFGSESNLRQNLLKAALRLEELPEEYKSKDVFNVLTENLLYAI